ncbi:MAG: glycosyltransferase [Myxococcales bacterium]|nr:glycosyltransferase [Myxococcales bacterium]
MRICALIKYPPIQGGVSSRSFWLTRGLAELGHEVHVVTHADHVEDEYRIELLDDDMPWLEYDPEGPGCVRLHQLQHDSRRYTHIPQGPMFTERLASLATQVVRRYDCELIYSYYFQPFGVAAHLASTWTGVPYTVQHAGSDLGRLMIQPDVHLAYREVITRADAVLTASPRCFLAMGVDAEALYSPQKFTLPTERFSPTTAPMDLRAHITAVAGRGHEVGPAAEAFDPALPTVGIYGKLGEAKGSYDLLHALAGLRRQGLRFNFMAMTRGRELPRYRQEIAALGLGECTWVLPFIAHHKVPAFIRACTAVTFLERDFPIVFHTPTIPTEILACGACLIVSREIADKQAYREQLRHGENVLIVEDPKDHGELAGALRRVLAEPTRAAAIAAAGQTIELGLEPLEPFARGFAEVFADVLGRRAGQASTIPRSERHLPEDRAATLTDFCHALWLAYGDDRMGPALRAYLQAHPEPAATAQRDSLRFCAFLREHPVVEQPPLAGWEDTLRLSEAVAWLGVVDDDDLLTGPFGRRDTKELIRQRWLEVAPLRTRWLRIEAFTALPAALPWASEDAGPDNPVLLAFHKQANMRGNVFAINAQTRDLLARCDGTRTARAIVHELAAETGQPPEAVVRKLGGTLMWWYTRGLVSFVDPD